MDPLGDVLLAVHEDLGDDFFCMICTNMTYMCHILSHLALKNYFLAVLEKSLSWVMVVTLILESLLLVLTPQTLVPKSAHRQQLSNHVYSYGV